MRSLLRSLSPALSLLALSLGSGCIVNNPGPNPNAPGDISFLWSFGGEERCASAGVDEVGVQVVSPSGNTTYFEDVVDCQGGGLTLTDFAPGDYDLWLDAFSADGRILYQGEAPVRVRPGVDNDIGEVLLEPVVQQGALALFWGFLYPTDDSAVFNCDVAGVSEIDLEIAPLGGQGEGYVDTFACDDEGVVVDGLVEGDYRVTLVGYGRYQGQDLALYETAFDVDVPGGVETDLGDVFLERIFESFADIEVTWDLTAGTCAQLGVTEVELSIRRVGTDIEDDAFTVECDRTFALRETFVPGSYLVEAVAEGNGNAVYVGASTVNVAPNTTSDVNVELVLDD